jgi:hypothetical protein
MNVLNQTGTDYDAINIARTKVKRGKTIYKANAANASEKLSNSVSLCTNCDNNDHCILQGSDKIFCELYQ